MPRLNPGRIARKAAFLLAIPFIGVLNSCEDSQPTPNQPPDTRLSIDTIKLEGENRLQSTVTLNWSGTDQDGFVQGYEYRYADRDWEFVTTTDSTFRFLVEQGDQYRDIQFEVRAVDNNDTRDPDPASLTVPVKNSPPQAKFSENALAVDTVFTITSLSWEVSDPDGNESLDSAFLRVNDGPWVPVSRFAELITLVPENPQSDQTSDATLFEGLQAEDRIGTLPDLNMAEKNTFYLKATDIAGATSAIDTLGPVYTKPQQSDLLVLAASPTSFPDPRGVYKPILNEVYGTYDYIDLYVNDQRYLPQFWNAAFAKRLTLYDKVFLFADDNTINQELILESASEALQRYLSQDGRLFITTKFPNDLRSSSSVFNYSPMRRIPEREEQARIPTDSVVKPLKTADNAFKPLKASSFIIGVDAFTVKATGTALYQADLRDVDGQAVNTVIATGSSGGQVNQVFCAVPLHKLNQQPGNLKSFFNVVLNEKLE